MLLEENKNSYRVNGTQFNRPFSCHVFPQPPHAFFPHVHSEINGRLIHFTKQQKHSTQILFLLDPLSLHSTNSHLQTLTHSLYKPFPPVPPMDAAPQLVYCGIETGRFSARGNRSFNNIIPVRRRTRPVLAIATEPKPTQNGPAKSSQPPTSRTVNGNSRSPPLKTVNGKTVNGTSMVN